MLYFPVVKQAKTTGVRTVQVSSSAAYPSPSPIIPSPSPAGHSPAPALSPAQVQLLITMDMNIQYDFYMI